MTDLEYELAMDFASLAAVEARKAAEKAAGRPLSCNGEGCFYCCYPKIVVGAGEGALIYRFLKETGAWNEGLRDRLVEADRVMRSKTHHEYFRLQKPCVFLLAGRCSVYSARPYCCISIFSIGEPKKCASLKGKNIFSPTGVRDFVLLLKVLLRVSKRMGAPISKKGFSLFALPGSVLFAHAKAEGLPEPDVVRMTMAFGERRQIADAFDETSVCR